MKNLFSPSVQWKTWFRAGSALLVACAVLAAPLSSHASEGRSKIFKLTPPPGGGTDPNSSGTLAVRSDPNGPDTMLAFFTGLAAKTCYAVFLTNSVVSGSTPGSLLGQFCSDANGKGNFAVRTEILNGFVFTNLKLDTDGDGIVVHQVSGALANGGIVIPTSIVRVYRATPGASGPTVFGVSPKAPGGLHTLSSPLIN